MKPNDKYPIEFTPSDESAESLTINMYQIISIAEQGKTKGKSSNIQFSKATILRVVQLLDNVFDSIREKVNAEIEAKEDSATSEASEEESEEEVKTVSKKTKQKTAPAIVRAKRPGVNT